MVPSPQLETISTNEKFEQGHETVQPRGGNDGEVLADLGYTQAQAWVLGNREFRDFFLDHLDHYWYNDAIRVWAIEWWTGSHVDWVDHRFVLHDDCRSGDGRDRFGCSDIRRALPPLLSRPSHSPFAAYCTGFFNLLGQAAVTAGITFGNSILISTLGSVHGFSVTSARQVGISAGLLVFGGIVNTFGIRFLALLNRISIALHSVGVFAIVVALLVKAPTHRTAKEVFATFNDESGWSERASPAYVALTGILVAQYVLTGFDASAHLSEETEHAAKNAPIGVLISVLASAIFGFFVMVSFLFCIQPSDSESTVGQPVLQIFIDAFGVKGATAAFSIVIVCVVLCGTFSITSNSRMYFACARDSLIPKAFSVVNERFASPVRAVWLAVVLALILILPALGSTVAFAAVTAIATSGLYLSYALPVAFRLLENERFLSIRGPFYLGRFSRPISWICVTYVVFITIIFCLPTVTPVDSQTLNYTPIALGIVFAYILISWFAFARRTFHGPRADALKEAARALGGEGANTVNRLEREVTTDSAMKKKEGSDTRVREVDTVEGGGDYK